MPPAKRKPPSGAGGEASPGDDVFDTAAPPPPQAFVKGTQGRAPASRGPPGPSRTGRQPKDPRPSSGLPPGVPPDLPAGTIVVTQSQRQGPACTFGLGGGLLERHAVLFWTLTGLTYVAGLWLLGYILLVLYLAWALQSCGEACGQACGTCTCQGGDSDSSSGGCCDPCCSCDSGQTNTTSTDDPDGDQGIPAPGLASATAATLGALGLRRMARMDWSHHPDLPEFRADVWRLRGRRVCVGCSVTYPVFAAALTALQLAAPAGSWALWLAAGLAFAAVQAVSALGWTRWRWLKAIVKAALGLGMAAAFHGILSSPWPNLAQGAALTALVALASLSTLPRRRRIQAALDARRALGEGDA